MKRVLPRGDVLVALLMVVVHAILSLGYTGTFWGDFGRWSYEVQRFASGGLPYRDFQWHFPPLAIWLFGGAARIIGTSLSSLALISSTVMVVLSVCYAKVARRALGRVDAPLVAVCLLLGFAYSQPIGGPITLGGYTPATPVGALCVFAAMWCSGISLDADDARGFSWHATMAGTFAALAVLSKQDFWIPAAYLVLVTTIRTRRVETTVAAALVAVAGISVIAATAGPQVLLPLAGGFGHVSVTGGSGFPSW